MGAKPLKKILVAILAGVTATLVIVFGARLLFAQDISGVAPAIGGAVAGAFLMTRRQWQKDVSA